MTGGFGFPFGCVAAVAGVIAADLAGATASPWYALVTLGLVVLLTAFWTTFAAAFGVFVVAWALDSGFVLGRSGSLVFDAASALAALTLALALTFGLLTSFLAAVLARTPVRIPAPRHPGGVAERRSALAPGSPSPT